MQRLFSMERIVFLVLVTVAAEIYPAAGQNKKEKLSDDPTSNSLLRILTTARNNLRKGIWKTNVPNLGPVFNDEMNIQRTHNELQFNLKLVNFTMSGSNLFIITKLSTDVPGLAMSMSIIFPALDITTVYDVDGSILHTPLKNRGILKTVLVNTQLDLQVFGKKVDEPEFASYPIAQVIDTKANLVLGSTARLSLEPIFDNINVVDESLIKLYQQNSQEISDLITPIIEETTLAEALKIVNHSAHFASFNTVVQWLQEEESEEKLKRKNSTVSKNVGQNYLDSLD